MKSFAAALCLGLSVTPAFAADGNAVEKSPLYELHLRVPETAMKIGALKQKILALYDADADLAKSDAKRPGRHSEFSAVSHRYNVARDL